MKMDCVVAAIRIASDHVGLYRDDIKIASFRFRKLTDHTCQVSGSWENGDEDRWAFKTRILFSNNFKNAQVTRSEEWAL